MNYIRVLTDLIREADILVESNITTSKPSFKSWINKAERFLVVKFGENSFEYNRFFEINYAMAVSAFSIDEYHQNCIIACKNGLFEAKSMLEMYLEEEKDEAENELKAIHQAEDIVVDPASVQANNNEKVFIVHGHNGEMKEAVARLVERQGIHAIILHEQANAGATIIEKFEKNSDAGAAICLFTADDVGKANSESEYKKRARQNVVFETGYFIGKLGRKRVVVVTDKGVDIPSDMQGVVYTDSNSWKWSVLQELKTMGFQIDFNKADA